jgi:hypothetical protein
MYGLKYYLTPLAALTITLATASAWEINTTWLPLISVTVNIYCVYD